ncbi:unnamed protein product [Adineta steineri]|uniref:DDE Tnp4 domain-containing protein n=1 Tax=Adineta steineri TaxID=433720 RepID=A0A813TL51_9BILA|nr:unnamed protein product [Adineta steineri]CAF1485127.1 unnamed protein product [Adineta steineri]CAF3618609.1 unnamed protein product [Adineta steineri]CAF4157320.1 unnamed protein product [Adineta steineri]
MIRLRRATEEHELGIFFNISQSTVSRIIIAWTRFIYSVVSSISLWPSKQQVVENLPFEIKKNYPRVRVIIDLQQCVSFAALVGITPNGIVSYISPLYGDATSDRSLLNMTGAASLMELLKPSNHIMSDRGFTLDLQHSHISLIHPPFLQRKARLSAKKVMYGKSKKLQTS